MSILVRFVLVAAALFASASASASFSGDYSLGTPGIYTSSTTLGNWTSQISSSFGNGSVDTNSAPDSVTLYAFADYNPFFSGTTTVTLSYLSLPSSGLISFDVDLLDGFEVYLDSTLLSPSGGAFSFAVSSGQTLTMSLVAVVDAGSGFGGPGSPGSSTTYSAVISNFSVVVPEPSTYALGSGVAVLCIAAFVRRRRLEA